MLSCRYVHYNLIELVNLISFQFQSGTYDCGLFSIAYATSLAYGVDPTCCLFNQLKMRRHLYQCLLKRRMSPFPHTEVTTVIKSMRARDDIEVHCHCRMPELKDVPMIECTKCTKWFHADCEAVTKQILDDSQVEWFCRYCK